MILEISSGQFCGADIRYPEDSEEERTQSRGRYEHSDMNSERRKIWTLTQGIILCINSCLKVLVPYAVSRAEITDHC